MGADLTREQVALLTEEELRLWRTVQTFREPDVIAAAAGIKSLLRTIASLRARLARAEGERGWQPIETAPKDGSELLVWAPGRDGLRAIYSVCAWHPDAGFCIDELRSPTHWMPLPSPPAALSRAEEGAPFGETIDLSPPGEIHGEPGEPGFGWPVEAPAASLSPSIPEAHREYLDRVAAGQVVSEEAMKLVIGPSRPAPEDTP